MLKLGGNLKRSGSEMIRLLSEIAKEMPDKVDAALLAEAEIEKVASQADCPVWDPARPVPSGRVPGELRDSAKVVGVIRKGRVTSAQIVYTAPYAAYVHEDMNVMHSVGKAKWLELRLRRSQPEMGGRIADRVRLEK